MSNAHYTLPKAGLSGGTFFVLVVGLLFINLIFLSMIGGSGTSPSTAPAGSRAETRSEELGEDGQPIGRLGTLSSRDREDLYLGVAYFTLYSEYCGKLPAEKEKIHALVRAKARSKVQFYYVQFDEIRRETSTSTFCAFTRKKFPELL